MSLTQKLTEALDSGVNQIGQIRILQNPLRLHHLDDSDLESLQIHTDPDDAREISLYSGDGSYRFTKGELSLKRGWIFQLENIEDLRRTLDLFYPAALGLWQATCSGTIRIQNLRDKLNRQTGMYRHARKVTDKGAQELVQSICGPSNQCVKKILWSIDKNLPLEDSEASRYNGIVGEASENTAIPMVCQEACNVFVAAARKKAQAEFEADPA
ncbi:DR2241 family protein [Verrucomicrobiaceae bacterium 227]